MPVPYQRLAGTTKGGDRILSDVELRVANVESRETQTPADPELHKIGLITFLAKVIFAGGVGTHAGNAFVTPFTQGGGIYLLIAGAVITTTAALAILWIGCA